jgi:hypothetical protein
MLSAWSSAVRSLAKPNPTSTLLAAVEELDWLRNNPAFEERPASIVEFLGERYLNIESGVRPGLKGVLTDIFGKKSNPYSLAKFKEAMMTGAIGIGKTTFASIALPYMAHWVLCLRDPQGFFDLLPGSRIAFMQMSTSEDQAREVVFGDIFARINHSPWFKAHPHDPSFKNQIRWPGKDIWIVPGDSAETTFEGYNILGGILDEMDSHRVTPKRDYAEAGYNTISNRISSRFQDRGLFILIGQIKQDNGFAARHFARMKEDNETYASRMTLWESFGWSKFLNDDGSRDSFWFDARRKIEIPRLVAETVENPDFMEIPRTYKKQFLSDPDRALRDLAGIPPKVGSPFIGMTHYLDPPPLLWTQRYEQPECPVDTNLSLPQFAPWFRAPDRLPRSIHIDIAYSDTGDALGIAMGHVRELKEVDDELQPYIVFDFLMRIRPAPGREIVLGDIRKIIYHVRDGLGFRIKKVTLDGFQSTDTIQQLQKKRFDADYLSVDRNLLPYQDLRDAIYEQRIEWPRTMALMKHGDTKLVDIAYQELSQLIDTAKKIDHPIGGSKDIADAMAGVTHTLMGDRTYRRGVSSTSRARTGATTLESDLPRVPVPPNINEMIVPGYGDPRVSVPSGVRGTGDIYEGTGLKRPTW